MVSAASEPTEPNKVSKASKRRAHKKAAHINAIKQTNPAKAQSELSGQFVAFQRKARRRANRLTSDQRVWELMGPQDRFIQALDMPRQDKEEHLQDAKEACRSAFTGIITGVATPLNGTAGHDRGVSGSETD